MQVELVCTKCCNLWPATSQFFSLTYKKSGTYLDSRCRACRNEMSKEYYCKKKGNHAGPTKSK